MIWFTPEVMKHCAAFENTSKTNTDLPSFLAGSSPFFLTVCWAITNQSNGSWKMLTVSKECTCWGMRGNSLVKRLVPCQIPFHKPVWFQFAHLPSWRDGSATWKSTWPNGRFQDLRHDSPPIIKQPHDHERQFDSHSWLIWYYLFD